ncbi:hypothetical protein NDU88_002622 [Pleurodeles waltl]|uniref:Tektin n=1 Tax=Pleurodeles waltl TaxID=8319 RepID=A0AAV7M4G5_PLEWA|nr:hypothetical protein NDU88_002622 [Pleurodeles waltl]
MEIQGTTQTSVYTRSRQLSRRIQEPTTITTYQDSYRSYVKSACPATPSKGPCRQQPVGPLPCQADKGSTCSLDKGPYDKGPTCCIDKSATCSHDKVPPCFFDKGPTCHHDKGSTGPHDNCFPCPLDKGPTCPHDKGPTCPVEADPICPPPCQCRSEVGHMCPPPGVEQFCCLQTPRQPTLLPPLRTALYARYSTGDWHAATEEHFKGSEFSLNSAVRYRSDLSRIMQDKDQLTRAMQAESRRDIDRRLTDIHYWHSELCQELEQLIAENCRLKRALERLQRALVETTQAPQQVP